MGLFYLCSKILVKIIQHTSVFTLLKVELGLCHVSVCPSDGSHRGHTACIVYSACVFVSSFNIIITQEVKNVYITVITSLLVNRQVKCAFCSL